MLDYLPYILLFALLIVASMFEVTNVKQAQLKWIRWGVLAFLLVFIGLRYNTGADWELYTKAYENLALRGNIMKWEPGFYSFMYVIRYVFGNYYVLQFFATLFLLFALNRFYTRNSSYPILLITLFTFLFFNSILMAQIRQSIALAIILLGSPYIFERDLPKFTLIIVLASMFHITSIVALLLYFLYGKSNKAVLMFILLCTQFFIFCPNIIIETINFISCVLPDRLERLVHVYTSSLYARRSEYGIGVLYFVSLALCFFVIYSAIIKDGYNGFFLNALVFSYVLIAISNSVLILGRFQSYFHVFGLVAIVNLLDLKIKNVSTQLSKFVVVCMLCALFIYPLCSFLTTKNVDVITGKCFSSSFVPYYNLIKHPAEADYREE